MKKLKVGILMGGPSTEHEVSLKTGENVFKNLDRKKYVPTKIVLTKEWKLFAGKSRITFPEGLQKFDIIFNALHGSFGENGLLQTILDDLGIRYTGSGAKASWLGMDKWLSQKVFKRKGIPVPNSRLIKEGDKNGNFKFPLVLKPRRGGSSVGVGIVKSKKELNKKLSQVFKYEKEAVAQEYIRGEEFTCGILEINGKAVALPVIEIRPMSNFFDYKSKYTKGASEEIVPARIGPELTKKIQNFSIKAHKAVGCYSYSRSDFMVKNNKPFILEINTLPGLTKNSLVPKAAQAAGISFSKLLDVLIKNSY